ncbi:hypothetical protein PF005_g1479 [Phytophthora fragariae]|uniref:Amine oxidase n=1 Tax=Phytophthora fragariae TaxID=53985 RepID=A0A6A3TKL2_9STRA|nr:hypothetical protein PF007_g1477 [Phytophthora fragariae]KAE9235418.1 hypothetical protein PF005_g1479 [Phytophthora fragariae]
MPNLSSEPIETPLEASYRVVVIGAGLAGVSAANELLSSGHFDTSDVCVLEAQTRIGGRVQTKSFSDSLPVNVEVGAAWIHGTEGNPFAALAKQFGISFKEISPRNPWLHPGSCSNFLLFDGSRQLSNQQTAETWAWQDLLMRKLQQLARSDHGHEHRDKTLSAVVEHLLDSDRELLEVMGGVKARAKIELFLRLMEAWFGLTVEDLNLDVFVETDLMGDDPGAHCIVPAGMERFIDHLAEPLQDVIHTNVSVASINYDGADGVIIECNDGRRVTADRVIVATSLGLLQSGKLHFQPELPAVKTGALKRSKMGQYMKVLVQFPEVFWPKDATFMGQLQTKNSSEGTERRIYFPLVFNYHLAKRVPILEGVLIGDNASDISASFTDEEIAHALFLQMQETFGPGVPEPINHFITRWDQDQWSVGAYSCVTARNAHEDPDLLKQTVANRVLFAGEAVDPKYQGALQAAYFSGLEAAAELVAQNLDDAWLTESDVKNGVKDTTGLKRLDAARSRISDVGLSEDAVKSDRSKEEVAALKGPVNVMVLTPDAEKRFWLVTGSVDNALATKGIRFRVYRLVASYLGYYDPARRVGDKDNALWYEGETLLIHSLFETRENALMFDNALHDECITALSPLNGHNVSTKLPWTSTPGELSELRRIYSRDYVPHDTESPQASMGSLSTTISLVDVMTDEFKYQRIESEEWFGSVGKAQSCQVHEWYDARVLVLPVMNISVESVSEDFVIGNRYKVNLIVRALDAGFARLIALRLKEGFVASDDGLEMRTFVYVLNKEVFCKCMEWKCKEVEKKWKEHNDMASAVD